MQEPQPDPESLKNERARAASTASGMGLVEMDSAFGQERAGPSTDSPKTSLHLSCLQLWF